ncbi:PREDICTED: unc-112-related protein-like [Papilio polytes]|uniref:unc-112-related protein-like n=1 Tax=Papilio polytes TaxID=76194 RepID=UPI000676AFD8|nr:PREDICTED: unc-112-related protein-like [Papilio polytes]
MLADGEVVGDGSWNLTIYVTDLNEKRTMVVKGDMHIGGVMLKLTESFGKDFKKDWSDHALWWPTRNKWLSRPKHTLDQYGVHADAALHFTPMHKPLRIQLPDLRYIDCKIDFSIDTFSAVVQLCKNLGIRHPEELSLYYPLEPSHLKQNYQNLKEAKKIKSSQPPDTNTFIAATRGSSNSLDRSNGLSGSFALKPKRFTLKAYKRGWVSCRDGVLRIHASSDAAARGDTPSYSVELRGAEVTLKLP